MPGDPDGDDCEIHEITTRPDWSDRNSTECTDGIWEISTRGGGAAETHDENHEDAETGKIGTLGVLCANWGGHWADRFLQDHMKFDLKSCPCHILCVQEAAPLLLQHLQGPAVEGKAETRGRGANWEQRPCSQYLGIRGDEASNSVMVCARRGLVKGMRLLLFHRRRDGVYRKTQGGTSNKRKR